MARPSNEKGPRMNLGNESELVEFKKSTGEHKEALQAICAILNKHGHGELYFGVKDSGDVIGQDVSDATIRQIASWISDKIEPTISPAIERLEDEAGRTFIRVEFSGAAGPYSADGRYLVRVGTSNNALSAAELSRMIVERDRSRNPWDSMPSGRAVSEANEDALRDLFERGRQAGRISGNFDGGEDLLAKLGMIAEDGTLTNAADVLFCDARAGSTRVSLARLSGNDKVDILDLRHEGGPLLRLLDEAVGYVLAGVSRKIVIPEDGTTVRQEIPEIPADAVREAVANALIHRDYEDPAAVEVCVYRDSVKILNPGLFPAGDSPRAHIEGNVSRHTLRNTLIADAVFRAGVVEKFGTGIPRIRRSCDEAGVTFRFDQRQCITEIVFDRPWSQVSYVDEDGKSISAPDVDRKSARTGDAVTSPTRRLNRIEEMAVSVARENGKITTGGLATSAGIGRDAARSALRRLEKDGVLEWVGKGPKDPHQHYRLRSRN